MVIRDKRLSLKMSQQDLADMLGVARSSVASWEIGVTFPRVEILIKLSQIFNCTIDELVKGGDDSNE